MFFPTRIQKVQSANATKLEMVDVWMDAQDVLTVALRVSAGDQLHDSRLTRPRKHRALV
jgi:hypothetical protein